MIHQIYLQLRVLQMTLISWINLNFQQLLKTFRKNIKRVNMLEFIYEAILKWKCMQKIMELKTENQFNFGQVQVIHQTFMIAQKDFGKFISTKVQMMLLYVINLDFVPNQIQKQVCIVQKLLKISRWYSYGTMQKTIQIEQSASTS